MSAGMVNRRELLLAALIVALNPVRAASTTSAGLPQGFSQLSENMPEILHDRELWNIGREYLRMHPQEANLDFLTSATIGPYSEAEVRHSGSSDEDIASIFRYRHQSDCAQLEMVKVKGIRLSRSEARLYGMAALVRAG